MIELTASAAFPPTFKISIPMSVQIELSLATAPFFPSLTEVEFSGIDVAFMEGKAAKATLRT